MGNREKPLQLTDVTVLRAIRMPSKRLGAKTGGRIAIDPAGNLLMTLGDRSDSPPWDVAQKMDNHLGKFIRITPDGTVPGDNPFVGKPGVLPEIWTYGMRSPEGLAYDPRPADCGRTITVRAAGLAEHRRGKAKIGCPQ